MIPLQLKIRNFLSYGSQGEPIDFEPHHLICLTGKNGHGKSAMLDAITWALWGQARKIAGIIRGDEHLIRLGESGMSVTLDFLCNNQRYRVTRDFSVALNKKGLTQLHLGLFRDEIQAYASLSEKNIRDTQEKLDAIVGLDYDTFINSVFLRQGQANEFSKKSPLERKEILSTLLGLSRYEELRKRALDHQRSYAKEHEILSHLTGSLTQEMSTKQGVLEQAAALEKTLEELSKTQKEQSRQLEELTIKQQQAAHAHTALALAQQSLDQQTRIYAQQRAMLVTLLNERRLFQRRKKALNSANLATEYEIATKKLTEYEALRTRQMSLREQLVITSTSRQRRHENIQAELQTSLQAASTQLNSTRLESERAQSALTEITQKLSSCETEIQQFGAKKMVLMGTLIEQEAINSLVLKLEQQIARKTRFADRWHLRMQQHLEARATALMRRQNLSTHDSACPLCTQLLPTEHRAKLIQVSQKDARRHTHRSNRLEQLLKRLDIEIELQKRALKTASAQKEQLIESRQQLVQINELAAACERDHATYLFTRARIQEQVLATQQQLVHAQGLYDSAVAALSTVPAQDHLLCTFAQEILGIEKTVKELEAATSAINDAQLRADVIRINEQKNAITLLGHEQAQNKKRSGEARAIIQELRINIREQEILNTTIKSLKPIVDALLANGQRVEAIRKELERLQLKKQLLFEEKGSLTRQLAVFEKRTQELLLHQEKIKQLEVLSEDYQILAQALSKNGIQALIIEQAVPELESEANALLARLTNNQAHVMFESLRDLKSGGSKETLDIKISDSMGTRPYELFSGGEAFRIDFALRIALSKLLARRAGTSLQTLIIDEGFGSQDEEGLALIQEALHVIQEDFEKILVVSHLPAMKHQFPTNFVVRKEADGSTVTVVEQG